MNHFSIRRERNCSGCLNHSGDIICRDFLVWGLQQPLLLWSWASWCAIQRQIHRHFLFQRQPYARQNQGFQLRPGVLAPDPYLTSFYSSGWNCSHTHDSDCSQFFIDCSNDSDTFICANINCGNDICSCHIVTIYYWHSYISCSFD